MPAPRRIGLAVEFHLLYKHHSELLAGIQRYADEQGWLTVIDDWIQDTLSRSPGDRPAYDGVIARVSERQHELMNATSRVGTPLVNVMRGSPAFDQLPGVFPDFAAAGRMRAEHLLSRGLRHFACALVPGLPSDVVQAAAFAEVVEAAGCSVTLLELQANPANELELYRKNLALVNHWMDRWQLPIGVASPEDAFARYVAQMVHERGWQVPDDVAIVAGMNEEKLCERPRPQLSSVEIGYERIGYEAARLLDSLMNEADGSRRRRKPCRLGRRSESPPAAPIHIMLPPVGVVVRESSDLFAVEDDLVAAAQAFMVQHCHARVGVREVAEALCVSVRTLQTRFARVLKRSVVQEMCRVRIERIKEELTTTDRSVHEIAKRTGFASHKRLCDVFKRETGVPPSEYRAARRPPKER